MHAVEAAPRHPARRQTLGECSTLRMHPGSASPPGLQSSTALLEVNPGSLMRSWSVNMCSCADRPQLISPSFCSLQVRHRALLPAWFLRRGHRRGVRRQHRCASWAPKLLVHAENDLISAGTPETLREHTPKTKSMRMGRCMQRRVAWAAFFRG